MNLPLRYEENLREILGEEFDSYLETFDKPFVPSIRVNRSKISVEEFEKIAPWELMKVPWTENGFYVPEGEVSRHPFYYAGLYYIQEASAMVPASRLPVKEGDRVCDLCAAPGGKATELATRIGRNGFLLANDISAARAKALQKNLEQQGFSNFCVSSENPEKLAGLYKGSFDAILVDAPCSGEGMFHRKPEMMRDWEEKGPEFYQSLQREILVSAVEMLKEGGHLLYSTCTFSPLEDEENVLWMMERFGLTLVNAEGCSLFSEGLALQGNEELKKCIRIWPHRTRGEGHFVALLKKEISEENREKKTEKKKEKIKGKKEKEVTRTEGSGRKEASEYRNFLSHIRKDSHIQELVVQMREEQVYGIGSRMEIRPKVRYLRTGLLIGSEKKNRFEPSQALAMALNRKDFDLVLSFSVDDPRVIRYLKGETIEAEEMTKNGWCLICVEGYPLGWGKCVNGSVRNKYYPGWRML